MSIIRSPQHTEETKIIVQTRKGTNIDNAQSYEISPSELGQYQKIEKEFPIKYFGAVIRTNLNPIYNCHGLTFASKRTSIWDNSAVHQIIAEDGYTEITIDSVLPGDVILYYGDLGDIEHSGIVVSKAEGVLKIPMVVSKWGRYKEILHPANATPYNNANIRYYRVTK